MNTIYS